MIVPSVDQPSVRTTHARAEEYGAFLRGRPSVRSQCTNQMKHYRSFRRRYPDLDTCLLQVLLARRTFGFGR